MDAETGEMKAFNTYDLMAKRFTPLPSVNEVLEIYGCNFLVESYDVDNRKMVLRGISKSEAKIVLMGGKLSD